MSLNFFTKFFGGGKRASNGEKEAVVEPHPVPIRRLSSSKSGKLKMRKVKSSQNIKDISFYVKPEDEEVKQNVNDDVEENISAEDVIKEMYEVVQNGQVKSC